MGRLCCPYPRQYYGLLRLLTQLPPGLRFLSLYQRLRWLWAIDRMRPLLFRRLLSQHPAPPTPESSSRLHLQVLHRFLLSARRQAAFPLADRLGSLLFPFGLTYRRCRAKLCFAIHFMLRAAGLLRLLSGIQRFSTSGRPEALVACYVAACLLAGLTVTTTGLAPASRRQLSGHTSGC